MSGKTISSFGVTPISTHCWSGDGNQLAISLNNKQVEVMNKAGGPGKWETSATLDQHDLLVTGIDWAPKTNRIVTCSADRNAYVWKLLDDGTWKHCLGKVSIFDLGCVPFYPVLNCCKPSNILLHN